MCPRKIPLWRRRGRGYSLIQDTWLTVPLVLRAQKIIFTTTFYEKDVYSISDTGYTEKKNRVLPTRVEPINFWLPVQMLYHWATGASWELRPIKEWVSDSCSSGGLYNAARFVSLLLRISLIPVPWRRRETWGTRLSLSTVVPGYLFFSFSVFFSPLGPVCCVI